MTRFGGDRDGAGERRRSGRRLPIAMGVLALVAATTAPAVGQPAPSWPDGEWVGVISGSGSAAGTLEGRAGAGSASASGGFTVNIVDGAADGGYGVTWVGQGASALGEGQVVIDELGVVEGTDGQPLLIRESFTGTVTADGVTIPLPGGPLDPAPTPLLAEDVDCGVLEGSFRGKLSAMASALESFGISAASEERFVAFGGPVDDSTQQDAYSVAAARLGDLRTGLIQLEIIATADNIDDVLADMETILAEAEEIMAGLEGMEGCELSTAPFRLGITHAASVLIARLFELAGDDSVLIENLAIYTVRSGATGSLFLREQAQNAISDAVDRAEAAEDKDALSQLAMASLALGLTDLFQRIMDICEEIAP